MIPLVRTLALLFSVAPAFAFGADTSPASAAPPPETTATPPLPAETPMDPSALHRFGLIAIQDNNRLKPIDSFAEESLVRLSGRAKVKDKSGRTWRAMEWAASMFLGTHDWTVEPLILVGYRPLIVELALDAETKRFSFAELSENLQLQALSRETKTARASGRDLTRLEQEVESVETRLNLFHAIHQGLAFTTVPPPPSLKESVAWMVPTPEGAIKFYGEQGQASQLRPLIEAMRGLLESYRAGNSHEFASQSDRFATAARALNPSAYPSSALLRTEQFYNHGRFFTWATVFYGLALLALALVRSDGAPRWLNRLGLAGTLAGLLAHSVGLVLRCYIAGRAPVTNMYESVVWVALVSCLFGLVFYYRYQARVYLLSGLPVAFLLLLLLSMLPVEMPARLDPLVPVLRDNFWLTVHVLTITSAYAAFALAMALGHIVLFAYILNPWRVRTDTHLHFLLYRVLQLGVLLLATGTILGGVWANYSWGRFWGWDPKETWAFIALLMYIFAIHGRLAGWWGPFGLAVASVVCFQGVLMTWYGVNFWLGKGLHSYGFGVGGGEYVAAFIVLDILFIGTAIFRNLHAHRSPAPAGTLTPTTRPQVEV